MELDLTPGALEKTNDPVRMYLREMGTVPLLTRDGEVEIAKRIERGQLRVLQVLSRAAIVIKEIMSLGEQLAKDPSIIKDLVTFTEDDLTEAKIEKKHSQTVKTIADIDTETDRGIDIGDVRLLARPATPPAPPARAGPPAAAASRERCPRPAGSPPAGRRRG